MVLLVFLAVMVLSALVLRFGSPLARRYRVRAELRGDWWERFERDFRSYAGTWRSARDGERHSY